MGTDLAEALVNVLGLLFTALVSASPGQAVPIHLASIDEAVVGEFEAAEVESRLRTRLSQQKGLRLVEEPEPGAVRLKVTGCFRARQSKTAGAKRDPVTPTTPRTGGMLGDGLSRATDYGASVGRNEWVFLSVLVIGEDETREVVSGDRDLSLQEAVSTVVRELEKVARKKARPRRR